MNWTQDKPPAEGVYWLWRTGWDGPVLVEVARGYYLSDQLHIYHFGMEDSDLVHTFPEKGTWWLGPVKVPALPKVEAS